MCSDPRPGGYKVQPGPFVADDPVSSARVPSLINRSLLVIIVSLPFPLLHYRTTHYRTVLPTPAASSLA